MAPQPAAMKEKTMNKTLKSMVAVSLLGLASLAHADHDWDDDGGRAAASSYTDWARVVRVTPRYERVSTPARECRTEVISSREPVYREDGRSVGGAVLGGLAGGILGHQVGRGSGQVAATAVGAVVGAVVGDRIDNNDGPGYRTADYEGREREVERCRVIDREDRRLVGYRVEYEYDGRTYARFMTSDPGRRLPVRVSVEPQ
jgi:uncharacterized protein YcfJ